MRLIGSTIDDAAGEAFDKVAAILGLPYPGGPSIERVAREGDPAAVRFPRAFINDARLDFSFSGVKTAVLYEARGMPGSSQPAPELTARRIADIAASFQAAAVDVLVAKCRQAARKLGYTRLLIGGGVAANGVFRASLQRMADEAGIELHLSPGAYCTDNAAMAALGWELLDAGREATLDIDVTPGLIRHG
jgi:N6-L-threonylcarbamoyladenine synthase